MSNKRRVLVVDDENIVLNSCIKTFECEGFEVETALSGVEGIRKAAQNNFDVIITDYKIPDIDGIEIVEYIRKENPDSPIIMITGYSTNELEIRAAKSGIFEYIEKPFTPDEINSVVKRAIEWRRRTGQEMRSRDFPDISKTMDAISRSVGASSPEVVCDTITRTVGVNKAKASLTNLLILGFFAGVYIGFGAALATLVSHDAVEYVGLGITKLLSGAVFSVGLMLVVIAGAELFTGNNLMIASAMDRKIKARTLLEKWAIVYFANFAGSIFLVTVIYFSGLWKTGDFGIGVKALSIANAKVNLPFYEALFRGIGCNWLVCLAVWMAASSRQIAGKILAIFFPITAFVALGFEHCVANMYFIPLGLFLKTTIITSKLSIDISNLTWTNLVIRNLIPVTIGNIIGGAFFVGAPYWFVFLRAKAKNN